MVFYRETNAYNIQPKMSISGLCHFRLNFAASHFVVFALLKYCVVRDGLKLRSTHEHIIKKQIIFCFEFEIGDALSKSGAFSDTLLN